MSEAQIRQLRWAAAKLILDPGLSGYAAEGFVRAIVAEARRAAGDASFGDLRAIASLAEFLFIAAQLDLSSAPDDGAP